MIYSKFKNNYKNRIADKTDDLVLILTKLENLLANSQFFEQAEVIRDIINTIELSNYDIFFRKITSVNMWGGSGAVWEVYGFNNAENENEFRESLLKLIELMHEIGIDNRRIKSTSKFLKKLDRSNSSHGQKG